MDANRAASEASVDKSSVEKVVLNNHVKFTVKHLSKKPAVSLQKQSSGALQNDFFAKYLPIQIYLPVIKFIWFFIPAIFILNF